MRLKFLFFPIVIVICIAIFSGYIWPEINDIRIDNAKKQDNMQILDNVQKRKADINALGDQISSNIDDKKIVDNYLPFSNAEERIIGGINYLSADAGLTLLNISMTENKSINTTPSTTSNTTGIQSDTDNTTSNMQFNEASISVFGEYEKINLFIDKLQKMALFNSIKSLIIANSTSKELTSTVVSKDVDQTSVSKNLTAEIIVKFGYLKPADSNNQIAKLDQKIDDETINALKLYISGKDASSVSSGDTAGDTSLEGKKNPFFLE